VGQLQQQISQGQSQINSLAGAVGAASSHLAQLGSSIASLERQIVRIQADLDAKRAELVKLRAELLAARIRLAQLVAFEKRAEGVLAKQLVNSYESDNPDLVSVVLDSTGFRDLLERLAFQQRIRKRNVQVITEVRAARRAVALQAVRLGALEVRQQYLTNRVLQQRNNLTSTKISLVQQQIVVAKARQSKVNQLASARDQVSGLQGQLSQLEASLAAQAARARAAAATRAAQAAQAPQPSGQGSTGGSSGSPPAPSQVSSGGGFTFPLPKGSAVGPGSWSLDDGVDISAPGNTPEYAVCSGTIVLHGIGGFGPDAPVLHCDSPVGGYSYVYYGHAGPGNQLPVGTHVGAGSVMSEVGAGIVGISTGPHLEIGFADSSGSPVGPSSAPAMMALLQASY